jgi:diguanylate cyclase (GGDEF)-like protein
MTSAAALSEESRHEVRRIVFVSRVAGVMIALALAGGSIAIHINNLLSRESVSQFATVVVGLGAFVTISTLARVGHVRVLNASLEEVQELSDQLRDLADRDPLTGLYNMRAFYDALGSRIEGASSRASEVSLVVADLDNFKHVNDSLGHQFGDRVLIETARVFAGVAGTEGRAARLGGDEFALLLPGSSRAEAVEIARQIEADLRDVMIDGRSCATIGSFGIGTFPHDGESAQSLFAAADGRMYGEKHSRKSESLSALSHASWRVFVRAGQALTAGAPPERVLRAIADAAREEFGLIACVIKLGDDAHGDIAVTSVSDPQLEPAFEFMAARGELNAAAISAHMPGDAWLVGQPIGGAGGERGLVLLAGQPQASFRPDASVVVALADLILTVATEGGSATRTQPARPEHAQAA